MAHRQRCRPGLCGGGGGPTDRPHPRLRTVHACPHSDGRGRALPPCAGGTLPPACNVTVSARSDEAGGWARKRSMSLSSTLNLSILTQSPAPGAHTQTPRSLPYAANIAKPTASRFCKGVPTT